MVLQNALHNGKSFCLDLLFIRSAVQKHNLANFVYTDGLMQDCTISIDDGMTIMQSCTKPSILEQYILTVQDPLYFRETRLSCPFSNIRRGWLLESVGNTSILKETIDTPYHEIMGSPTKAISLTDWSWHSFLLCRKISGFFNLDRHDVYLYIYIYMILIHIAFISTVWQRVHV